ncbi:4-alpha-glucanotransferase [Janibacter melonis]
MGVVSDTLPSDLVDLAHAKGVSTEYWDWKGVHTHIPQDALRQVLTALGEDVSDDDAVRGSLRRTRQAPWRRTLPATVVARTSHPYRLAVHVQHGRAVRVHVELEGGGRLDLDQVPHDVAPVEVDGVLVGEAAFEIPAGLPLGYHELVAEVEGEDALPDPTTRRATFVAVPDALELPAGLDERAATGLTTQLYQVRSETSWGLGDLGVLRELSRWAAREHGHDFVLVNPLHAAEPVAPVEPSPYLPTSRRFVSPLYVDIATLPDLDRLEPGTRARIDDLAAEAAPLNRTDVLDRDASWALRHQALRIAYAELGPLHAQRMQPWYEAEGEGLLLFATWWVVAQVHGPHFATDWPAELRDPASPAVADFQRAHTGEISFACWVQWVLQEQLAAAQEAAVDAGMRLGVVHDLAVGIHPKGADAWALGDALARGVTVGAPPDQFNQRGQDWSQPPWRPDRLAELGYAPYRDMIRAVLRDAGGVRVDHVIGLFRLWWIPVGHAPTDGAYVRYDHEAMIGILALEAHRAGAVVVGEDLGVVEPWVREYLLQRGVLGTSIVWFEQGEDGRPLPPQDYRRLCLASVTTHDLPPTAGYLELRHVELRDGLGLLTRSMEEELAAERDTVATMEEALVEAGHLAPERRGDVPEVVAALHRWLAATPSVLRGVALTDLVGDTRTINQPGTDEEYPNWRLPLADAQGRPLTLEDVVAGAGDPV